MIEIGIHRVKKRRDIQVHERRERRACKGELIQVEGSHHDWFEDRGPKSTLLVYIDDATNELLKLELTTGETMDAYFKTFKDYIWEHGIPKSMYTDKHNVFKVNPTDTKKGTGITQFGRALKKLGCEAIFAHSPEAKGRVERANRTLQDRLVKAFRFEKINTLKEANQKEEIDIMMSKLHYKKVFKGLIVKHGGNVFKLRSKKYKNRLLGQRVLFSQKPNEKIDINFNDEKIDYELYIQSEFKTLVLTRKDVNHNMDYKAWKAKRA